MERGRVLGVDACKGGWVGIALGGDRIDAYFAPNIATLVARADSPSIVAIDIPIGLPDNGIRRADREAREKVGPRWQSVFVTPVRDAIEESVYEAAGRLNRERTGQGISAQAHALRDSILDVDRWKQTAEQRVVEVHPEVCFREMANGPLDVRKRTWAGQERRRHLLTQQGIVITGDLGEAGRRAGVDDVLDAAAAAWTARRVLAGEAYCLPSSPETFSDGWPCAIWV